MAQIMEFSTQDLALFADETSDAPARAARFLKSLAHPDRLKLLCCLVEGEATVSELEDRVGVSQSAVSQHLLKLKTEGVMTSRKDGRQVHYTISDPLVLDIVSLLYGRFCATM